MYKELFKLFAPFKKRQYFLSVAGILLYSCYAIVIFSISYLVDYFEQGEFSNFIRIVLICIGLAIITFLLEMLNSYCWKKTINECIKYLRSLVLNGIMKKDPMYFIKNPTGDILSKIMNDVVIVAQSASIGRPMLQINCSRVLIVLVALFILNWILAIIVTVSIPLYYLLFNLLNKGIRAASNEEREKFSLIQTNVQETLAAIETIKIHKKEAYIHQKSDVIMENHLKKFDKLNRYQSIGSGLTSLFRVFLPIFIFLIGIYLAFIGQISIGALVSFYAFLPFLTEPINNLSDFYLGMQTTVGMSERVIAYLREDIVLDEAKEISSISSISFSNVSFRYHDEADYILNNFNLELNKGDKIAILGKSGSGKSTLLKIMIRFLVPTEGYVKVNGIDLQEINTSSCYSRIALLQQNPFLFRDTILNNITFGDDYSNEQIQHAIEQANISSLLNKFSKGLHHQIEEIGKNLSGGEQQRLCLVRTLIRDADLLLLDEPTSALDENNERLLVENLSKHLEQHDCIFAVVTHRKEILNICNRAIFFKNGQAYFFNLNEHEQRDTLLSWMEED